MNTEAEAEDFSLIYVNTFDSLVFSFNSLKKQNRVSSGGYEFFASFLKFPSNSFQSDGEKKLEAFKQNENSFDFLSDGV